MQTSLRLLACSVLVALPGVALGDIIGLAPGSYAYNQGDGGSPALVGPNSIQLTTGAGQNRSIWFNQPQTISSFEAHFTYQEWVFSSNPTGRTAGMAFVISNSPLGTAALGSPTSRGLSGITPCAAVVFNTIGRNSSVGFYRNGASGGSDTGTTPIDFSVRRDIDVSIHYDGSLLTVSMTDGDLTFGPQTYLVGSLANSLGSSTAYIGFTAGNGDLSAYQILNDFSYTVPAPGALAAFGLLGLSATRRRRG
ncbi:MAG: hypothetical protein AB7Q00_12685 [Phycisphaerales bacterium]